MKFSKKSQSCHYGKPKDLSGGCISVYCILRTYTFDITCLAALVTRITVSVTRLAVSVTRLHIASKDEYIISNTACTREYVICNLQCVVWNVCVCARAQNGTRNMNASKGSGIAKWSSKDMSGGCLSSPCSLSICVSVYLSIYRSIDPSIHLSIFLSFVFSIYLSDICLSIYLTSVYLSIQDR